MILYKRYSPGESDKRASQPPQQKGTEMAEDKNKTEDKGDGAGDAAKPKRELFIHSLPYLNEKGEPTGDHYFLGDLVIGGDHVAYFYKDTSRQVKLAVKTYLAEPATTEGPERVEL